MSKKKKDRDVSLEGWDKLPEDDDTLDPDTARRKAAREACEELDLPDFMDRGDYDGD